MSHAKRPAAQPAAPFVYRNQRGVLYYLHQGQTKKGATRYFFARTVGPGALTSIPPGYEVTESINAVVSLRRVPSGPPLIPPADVRVVSAALARHAHLAGHKAEARKAEIIVYEPSSGPGAAVASAVEPFFGNLGWFDGPLRPSAIPIRYQPVMKFVRSPAEPDQYDVHRMTYRGEGGWSHPLARGPLSRLLRSHLPHIGRESFYELY